MQYCRVVTVPLRSSILEALQRVPEEKLQLGEPELMRDYLDAGLVNIVQLIYQQRAYEEQAKDYEFSADSMRDHWRAG